LLSASSLLAACGGHATQSAPRLPKSDAAQLIALAQTVAQDAGANGCTARSEIDALSAKARELVAAGSVPLQLRSTLLNGVAALTADAPACTPSQPPGKHDKPPKQHHDHGHHGGD
jgi:hypothetical protein